MPLIKRMDDTVEWIEVGGLPLGTGRSLKVEYKEVCLDMNKGDMIIFTSDGVVEAVDAANEMFGFDRLEKAVKAGPHTGAEAMLDYLQAEIAAFVGQTEPYDDLTIVVAQI